jgi:hypothetical protein
MSVARRNMRMTYGTIREPLRAEVDPDDTRLQWKI